MARELKPYDDEFADPEASYRRGFQHGAALNSGSRRIIAFTRSRAVSFSSWNAISQMIR